MQPILASRSARPLPATLTDCLPVKQIMVSLHLRPSTPVDGSQMITRSQFAVRHCAVRSEVEQVGKYATDCGLRIMPEEYPGEQTIGRTIRVQGSAADIERAFVVNLMHTEEGHLVRDGMVHVPDHLFGIIQAVSGLDKRPLCTFKLRRHTSQEITPSPLNPVQESRLYGVIPATAPPLRQLASGILCLGGGYTKADIQAAADEIGCPYPNLIERSADGTVNSPGDDSDVELKLDIIEQMGAIAAWFGTSVVATIYIYYAANTNQGMILISNMMAHDGLIANGSSSWGASEDQYDPQTIQQLDQNGRAAASMSVGLTAASGDGGSRDGTSRDVVDCPAMLASWLGVGATELIGNDNAIASETVWDDLATGGGASGGGSSMIEPMPAWQEGLGLPAGTGRAVPDMCACGAPRTGAPLGSSGTVGGTSESAPFVAATKTAIDMQLPANTGFINDKLQAMFKAGCFNDITSGSNGTYTAGTGYDRASGWGSPKPMNWLRFFQGASIPTPTEPPAGTPPVQQPPVPVPTEAALLAEVSKDFQSEIAAIPAGWFSGWLISIIRRDAAIAAAAIQRVFKKVGPG